MLTSLLHVAVHPCLCNTLWEALTTASLTALTGVGWHTVANDRCGGSVSLKMEGGVVMTQKPHLASRL